MSLPPSIPSPSFTSSTSSFAAASTSVPSPPSCAFLPMLSRALPFANGEMPVSSAIARKSYKERPSARRGGVERSDV
ncbi:hypothetical protein PILCRDRAFT_565719 [Piloderma croceum F 1598]|uniref:Uncharacterized protein n=1 Tax=Piloderma croceum (strain F 1598) TaxID=765440 RepID=A0A0C3AZD4_PILCF|nr:hypothetical protein PILCRDRAFT_565719 [Piloderma croceum F 1598]